jgi:uncharacterized protein YcgL (UPF0745 family)
MHADNLQNLFHLPLSEQAYQQMQLLLAILQQLPVSDLQDSWSTSSGKFTAKKAYIYLEGHEQIPLVFHWLWKTFCQPKHKIFFWLLLKDRLSTRNLLRRKNMILESYDCVLCQRRTEETLLHLFFACPFAQSCWSSIGFNIQNQSDIFNALDLIRGQANHEFFLLSAILMTWSIWGARNDYISKGIQPSLTRTKSCYLKELQILSLRASTRHKVAFDSWILNL